MTANNTARIGEGDVTITLDGEEVILKPTWIAAQTISRQSGGILGATERVMKLDLDTVTQIVALGMGYGPGRRPPPDLAEKIWRTGFTDDSGGLAERCVTYLRTLANGGRKPPEDKDVDTGGDQDRPPKPT